MTSPPLVLTGYRLVRSEPCACFTSMYIQNLPAAHAFAVVWRLICTSCCPSSASYGMNHFLASHSLKPAPFGVGLLLGRGLFLLRSTPLFFSTVFVYPAILLCHSCRGVIWPKLARSLWACWLFFPQWLSIVIWAFLATLGILGPFSISAFPWTLLTSLDFPDPITLSFILGIYELSINPLLSLLLLFRACYGLFSLFYITYCLWVYFFSLSWLF